MINEAAIAKAIVDLKTQTTPRYTATAKKYEISRETLRKRFLGQTVSRMEAHLDSQGHLNLSQEKALVDRINTLSLRGLPPTPENVRNLASELCGEVVGEHWVPRFVKRHQNQLTSVYMKGIDFARRIADHPRHFEHYFNLVRVLCL